MTTATIKLQNVMLIYRNLLNFYTLTTKYPKEKLKKQSNLASHQKEQKYLGVNLPKEAKGLYSENYKMLLNLIEENTNRWKDILCS